MTLLFAGKKTSRSRGGAKPKAYPLMPLAQTARQRKSEKKRKMWGGERGKKNFIIIKDKSYV